MNRSRRNGLTTGGGGSDAGTDGAFAGERQAILGFGFGIED